MYVIDWMPGLKLWVTVLFLLIILVTSQNWAFCSLGVFHAELNCC